MNSRRNSFTLVFFVALFVSANSAMAQPIKLPSPTDPIEAKEVKIKAETPVWSPLGDKIAFIRVIDDVFTSDPNPRQLCIIEESSDSPKVIASISGLQRNFCWSPDGKKIAFVEANAKDGNIYTIDLATNMRVKITDHKEHYARSAYCDLSWSPDGTKIAFSVKTPRGMQADFQIWIVDSQGKFWFKLTEGFYPVWFPDSKKLAFATGTPEGQSWFFTIDIDGKNPKEIKNPSEGAFIDLRAFCLSPDAKYLLCSNYARLNVAKPDEAQPTTTTILGDRSGDLPTILGSTGRIMAMVKDGNVQILDISKLISINTAKNGKITPNGAVISQFKAPNLTDKERTISAADNPYRPLWSWSPDIKEIAFVGKNDEIWKMSANGTNQKQLTFERTKLTRLAQEEQKKAQDSANSKLESELKK